MKKNNLGEQKGAPLTKGLTLVEVMVGMLISAICLGTSLQAYIGAVSIRAKSRQLNTAISKMEANAETIRQLSKETTECKGNYVQALMKKVVAQDTAASTARQSTKSSTDPSSSTVEIPDLSLPQSFIFPSSPELPQDYRLTRKMDIATDTPNVLKVSYTLTRPSTSASYRILESVASADQGSEATDRTTVAQLSLAVMPSAALLCP
jgi:prepilin-type N-terminal cleavage/methylation domain-containing protein